jgi:hypothetical protein
MNTRRRTLETDRAQYLHDSICALLPFVPLALDHATHSRRTGTDKVIVIVDQVSFGAHDDDGHAGRIVCERART